VGWVLAGNSGVWTAMAVVAVSYYTVGTLTWGLTPGSVLAVRWSERRRQLGSETLEAGDAGELQGHTFTPTLESDLQGPDGSKGSHVPA
jgi:hypothetical protein